MGQEIGILSQLDKTSPTKIIQDIQSTRRANLEKIHGKAIEEIKADEILNINLQLLTASITDLNINLSNFKNELQYNQTNVNAQTNRNEDTNEKQNILEDLL